MIFYLGYCSIVEIFNNGMVVNYMVHGTQSLLNYRADILEFDANAFED